MTKNYNEAQLGVAFFKALEYQRRNKRPAQTSENKKMLFIKSTADALYQVLETETKKFNSANPDNRVLTKELINSVQNVLNKLFASLGINTKNN